MIHAAAAVVGLVAASFALAQGSAKAPVPAQAGAKPSAVALQHQLQPWRGDFDGMVDRGIVRVLVPYSRTLYFNDKGLQRGLTADTLRDFEVYLNERHKKGKRPITVIALPVTREKLITGLLEGLGDMAAGNITITKVRDRVIDFSAPIAEDVHEIVVTGPRSPKLAKLDDLAGQEVHVRKSSSYIHSLAGLNTSFRARNLAPMQITLVPEALEDEDMMDMVGAGLIKLIVVDSWKAKAWSSMSPRIKPRTDLVLSEPGSIGWAWRPNSPKLEEVVNQFITSHPTSRVNRFRAYQQYIRQLGNATAQSDWQRFEGTIELFRKYGARYRFDYLMLAAQGYQESRLDQAARSPVGAIGIMQVMPATGESLGVGDVTQTEPNVHAGARYMRQLYDRYLEGVDRLDDQNRTLLALASYNAGPGRVAALRKEAVEAGLDGDVWFDNVELIAARRVGQEPVIYVRNIYKYYVAYKLQLEALEARRLAGKTLAPEKPQAQTTKAKTKAKPKAETTKG